jgi:hypothetical protein
MKTFLLISVMLLASLFTEGRTVPDVHIRGVDIVQPQALDVVTIHLVELDNGVLFAYNLVLTEAAEPAPVYFVKVPRTLEGYSDVVNPPPLDANGKETEFNRYRDVWKWPLNGVAMLSNHNNYNYAPSYQRFYYYYYSMQANVTHPTSLKRYPSTKARMC